MDILNFKNNAEEAR